MKIVKTAVVVFALALLGTFLVPNIRADQRDKKTIVTFSKPFEIPGQVLPAGTYIFNIMEDAGNRDVVQIFNSDGSNIVAIVLAIPDYRLKPTDKTVITFSERAGEDPDALKAWFYPGDTFGEEFVYPKHRAIELAVASKEPVPALATDTVPAVAELKSAPIIAITPDQKEEPVAQVIQTAPAPLVAENTTPEPLTEQKQLPKTASELPLIALLGAASLGFAFVLKRIAG